MWVSGCLGVSVHARHHHQLPLHLEGEDEVLEIPEHGGVVVHQAIQHVCRWEEVLVLRVAAAREDPHAGLRWEAMPQSRREVAREETVGARDTLSPSKSLNHTQTHSTYTPLLST